MIWIENVNLKLIVATENRLRYLFTFYVQLKSFCIDSFSIPTVNLTFFPVFWLSFLENRRHSVDTFPDPPHFVSYSVFSCNRVNKLQWTEMNVQRFPGSLSLTMHIKIPGSKYQALQGYFYLILFVVVLTIVRVIFCFIKMTYERVILKWPKISF